MAPILSHYLSLRVPLGGSNHQLLPRNLPHLFRHQAQRVDVRNALADGSARLGADVDRYSFTVVDLHLLFFAGFDRRTHNSSHRDK
jgi:hypothetical protein